jgi:hypothetical protein
MMDPEMMTQAAPSPDAPGAGAQPSTDTGPLDSISIDPAEGGGNIVTHYPKASARVKNAGYESMKPRKYPITNHADLMKHLTKHAKRIKV